MPDANLEELAKGTMRRIGDVDLSDADAVRMAARLATGIKKKGAPVTLGVAGTLGARAMGEGDDPQRAMLIDLIRRVQAGEI
jgi:CO dehydrogenase/acetyl-CoA synthase alpha subunit